MLINKFLVYSFLKRNLKSLKWFNIILDFFFIFQIQMNGYHKGGGGYTFADGSDNIKALSNSKMSLHSHRSNSSMNSNKISMNGHVTPISNVSVDFLIKVRCLLEMDFTAGNLSVFLFVLRRKNKS